jgi:heat shock protein HslJ
MHPSNRRSRALKQLRSAALVCLAALPVLSCTDGVTGPSDVVGGEWRLASMRLSGGTAFVPAEPSRFTVEFKTDGFIGVRADCNSCGGGYSLSGDQLTIPSMACTLALCATPQGGEFANLIEGVSRVEKDGEGRLTIVSPDGTITLVR